ncbi:MAG TPA: transposase [Candidatus Sulfotelmatobacter sp.]|nr:transposase [Candidatus Sulfotelmatobacter sp.]
MKRTRRKFTPQDKAAIVREHLVEKVPVSDLCDKHGLKPTLFYRWQKDMLENMASLFERQAGSESATLKRENEALRQRLADKDRVIAQIMEDFVAVKKTIGGL